ncbi:MAG: helix-turn-helix domain-containing protein [Halobacteriota archaeon]|jgi:excisionase family DNA binding protein
MATLTTLHRNSNLNQSANQLLHSRDGAAQILGVHARTVDNLVKRGHLHPTPIGSRVMFHKDELARFAREGAAVIGATYNE